ncbi:uncharacterized protein EAF02_009617 [Botrytis sinoallii]|uniref:uncharacterized protein n=1 Tax=Botrytis sinoallii TaxID=1463999 RepID=UPI001900F57D|nr:uncharacterized protein EAF02_009617 [Botrytis sinoallii]KAF7868881.1 hypothetical protein EAF02_009617 [Botrytis sinoallii]
MTETFHANTDTMGILSLPREIHIVLGQHLDVKTLAYLVLVCREFRDTFTPILYAQWYSELILDGPRKPDMPPLPSNISLAKEVEVRIEGEFRDWDEADFEEDSEDEEVQSYREKLRKAFADYILRILKLGVGVQTLKLIDNVNDDTLFHAFTEESFQKALQACTKLKKVHMNGIPDSTIMLQQFQDLSFLELHNFSSETTGVEDIARLLSRCPHLKVLVLGPTYYGSSFEPYHLNTRLRRNSKYALEHLCDYYHTICEAKPLQLSRLVLPADLSPFKSASERVDNYLENLANTSFIIDLGFFNGLIAENPSNSDAQFCDIDYRLLENVGPLRSIKVTRLDSALRAWMNDEARRITDLRKLGITQLYSMYDSLLEEFNTLDLPRLSELSVREVTNVPNTPNLLAPVLEKPPGYDVLAPYTILDRLPGHGRSLAKLGLYLDFATQWSLTYLCIGQRRSSTDGLPGPNPDPVVSAHDALCYIKLISTLCPSLRYVKIAYRAWKISTGSQASIVKVDENDEFFEECWRWRG